MESMATEMVKKSNDLIESVLEEVIGNQGVRIYNSNGEKRNTELIIEELKQKDIDLQIKAYVGLKEIVVNNIVVAKMYPRYDLVNNSCGYVVEKYY